MRVKYSCWFRLALSYLTLLFIVIPGMMMPAHAQQRATFRIPSSPFVTSYGGKLYLNGAPFYFHGMDIFNAANTTICWYPLARGNGLGLDTSLSQIGNGQNAFRTWFFQAEATVNGQRDWSGMDTMLAVAQAHGEHVIAVLSSQWEGCELPPQQSGYRNEAWYQSDYRTQIMPYGLQTYRDWVASAVARYRNNPTILAWQLMNEAEDQVKAHGQCSSTATQTLYNWASDMSTLVKSIDPNHLLSLGTIGSGQCGANGLDYMKLHALPHIDLCEFHDYYPPNDFMPGDQWNGLQTRINECKQLGKPLFLGESGISGADVNGDLSLRAADFAAKFSAQFGAGVVGELVWDWATTQEGGSSQTNYQVGPGDPTLAILGRNYGYSSPVYAQVLSAMPAISSNLTKAPTSITVYCSADILPDPSRSNLFVYAANGQLLSKGNAIVAPSSPNQMSISINPVGNGAYTVHWLTASAVDGSSAQGTFTFTVNAAGSGTPSPSPSPTATSTKSHSGTGPGSQATPTIMRSGANSSSSSSSRGSINIPHWVPLIGGDTVWSTSAAALAGWLVILVGFLSLLLTISMRARIKRQRATKQTVRALQQHFAAHPHEEQAPDKEEILR